MQRKVEIVAVEADLCAGAIDEFFPFASSKKEWADLVRPGCLIGGILEATDNAG